MWGLCNSALPISLRCWQTRDRNLYKNSFPAQPETDTADKVFSAKHEAFMGRGGSNGWEAVGNQKFWTILKTVWKQLTISTLILQTYPLLFCKGRRRKEIPKELKQKHKSKKLDNLQMAKVDKVIWWNKNIWLQHVEDTAHTLSCISTHTEDDVKWNGPSFHITELPSDIFRSLAQGSLVSLTISAVWRDKDMILAYRPLCDQTPLATKLFGEKLQGKIKKKTREFRNYTHNDETFSVEMGEGQQQTTARPAGLSCISHDREPICWVIQTMPGIARKSGNGTCK